MEIKRPTSPLREMEGRHTKYANTKVARPKKALRRRWLRGDCHAGPSGRGESFHGDQKETGEPRDESHSAGENKNYIQDSGEHEIEFPRYRIPAGLWHYQRMGNKDAGRREIKKPKKKTPKPTAAPTANVVRQAPTRP
jgi:hypothetical protein